MGSVVKSGLLFACLAAASSVSALAAGLICTPIEEGQVRCSIASIADCQQVNDFPYHRNLFCPAAFSAAQEMVARVASTLGVSAPSKGVFFFYQTLPNNPPDDPSQTTIACMDTPAPYPGGSTKVVGAGLPLCHLVAYATSPGPTAPDSSGNPVPDPLRLFPSYFHKLYQPLPGFPLREFRTGSIFDPSVKALGEAGRDGFLADYPQFSPSEIYDPAKWRTEHQYHGISGGGGGGWGGEIGVVGPGGEPVTLLAFGGGGGGGMTSFGRPPESGSTALGAGGGGGMQFGNAFRVKNKWYSGLGLGAGVGAGEPGVQYSYNDYDGSGRPPTDPHVYNQAVIDDYEAQLKNLYGQLRDRFATGKTVVLLGGGGMGGGTEYLKNNRQEFEPHAMSTQAGFQYSYEFQGGAAGARIAGLSAALAKVQKEQQELYAKLGDFYKTANDQAFEECGSDYANYACMCPRAHAIVLCLVGKEIGDPSGIPAWLQEPHCSSGSADAPGKGFTSYQELLLRNAGKGDPPCASTMRQFFNSVNGPVNAKY
jgi:hypothetical protein